MLQRRDLCKTQVTNFPRKSSGSVAYLAMVTFCGGCLAVWEADRTARRSPGRWASPDSPRDHEAPGYRTVSSHGCRSAMVPETGDAGAPAWTDYAIFR